MARAYGARDIHVLEGLEAVRMRPGMYVGSTGSRGLHHLLWEIIDNAIDEAFSGYASKVEVTLCEDGSVRVADDGRGIPVDIHDTMDMPGVQVVFTHLHAGGKFNNDNYSYSGGLHGVGAAVVNALSRWLEVEVMRDGKLYYQRYESRYDNTHKKFLPGIPMTKLKAISNTRKTGTVVRFLPDGRVFDDIEFDMEIISKRLRELAFLNKGLKIYLKDERTEDVKKIEYCYDGGIVDFVTFLNEEKNPIHDEILYIEGEQDKIHAKIAIQYTDSYTESIFSYVNNIPTTEGGAHETGFKSGLTRVFNEYARRLSFLKERENNLLGEDIREGLTVIISINMTDVQFEGQTKTRLGNMEARAAIETLVVDNLSHAIESGRYRKDFEAIIKKSIKAAKVREAARRARDITRKKSNLEGASLVGKLSSCTGRRAEFNELFIVEGDSAGGSAKQGRDRRFQAILPLRGKPLNSEKKRIDQVLANEEIRTIIAALGTGIGEDFDISKLNYNRIIILSDADQDGAHIRAILLTFFFRYMKDLVTNGHVYIGMPPLYKIDTGKKTHYLYSDNELRAMTNKLGKGYTVQRYKGLGEMNPEQLWETTMDPQKRNIIQVTIDDAASADKLITTLMGDKVSPRRQYISTHANFNKSDTFQDMGV